MDRTLLAFSSLDAPIVPAVLSGQTLAYIEGARAAGAFAAANCSLSVVDCDCCDTLDALYRPVAGWTDPATDHAAVATLAPWVTADPYSADFLGFLWEDASGLEGPVGTRDVTDAVGTGGFLARLKAGARQATFRLSAYATSAGGMAAGRRWLEYVLRGGCVGPGCDEFGIVGVQWATYCPASSEACDVWGAFRELVDVGLVSGPTWTQDAECPDHVAQVEFTLASRSPYIYGLADDVCGPAGCVKSPDVEITVPHAAGNAAHTATAHRTLTDLPTPDGPAWGYDPLAIYEWAGTWPEWSDPDDATTLPLAGTWDPGTGWTPAATPGECEAVAATVVFTVTYATRAGGSGPDFSIGLVDATTGVRVPGYASGGNQVAGTANAGNFRATPGVTQRVAYTTSGLLVDTANGPVFPTFVARSAHSDDAVPVPDDLRIDSIDLYVNYACDAAVGACDCHFPHDFCHHPYQSCAGVAPPFADLVPLVTIEGTGGRGVRLEVVSGLGLGTVGCEDEVAAGGPYRTEATVVFDTPDSGASFADLSGLWGGVVDGTGPGVTFPQTHTATPGFTENRTNGWQFDGLLTPPADLAGPPPSVDVLDATDLYVHVRYTPLLDAVPGVPAFGVGFYDAALPGAFLDAGSIVGADGSNGVPWTTWDGYRGVVADDGTVELVLHVNGPFIPASGVVAASIRADSTALGEDSVRIEAVWVEVRWRAHYAAPAEGDECPEGYVCGVYNVRGDVAGSVDGRTNRWVLPGGTVESDGGGPPRPFDACCGDSVCLRWAWLPGDVPLVLPSVTVRWVPRYTG